MAVIIPILSKFDARGINKAKGAFGKLSKVGIGVGAVMGAASVAMAHFGMESIKAASAGLAVDKKLGQVNRSMGLFGKNTKQVTDRLKDYAKSTQFQIGVDEDVIKATQTKLLTFAELAKTADKTGGAFDRATMAALDLAAAGFGTAEGNAVQLGKALNDPVKGMTALTKSGITFTAEEKKKIETLVKSNKMLQAQDTILKAIEKQVGGTAEASVTPFQKMSVIFEELKGRIGDKLLPYIEKFSDYMAKIFDRMNDPKSAEAKAFNGMMDGVTSLMDTVSNFFGMWDVTGKGNSVAGFFKFMEDGFRTLAVTISATMATFYAAKEGIGGGLTKREKRAQMSNVAYSGALLEGKSFAQANKARDAAYKMYTTTKKANKARDAAFLQTMGYAPPTAQQREDNRLRSAFGVAPKLPPSNVKNETNNKYYFNITSKGITDNGEAVGREIIRRIKEYEKSNGSGWRRGSL